MERVNKHHHRDKKSNIEYEKDKSEKDKKEKIEEITIDTRKAKTQVKLILENIEIYFPYEPYDCQKLYMQKGK